MPASKRDNPVAACSGRPIKEDPIATNFLSGSYVSVNEVLWTLGSAPCWVASISILFRIDIGISNSAEGIEKPHRPSVWRHWQSALLRLWNRQCRDLPDADCF